MRFVISAMLLTVAATAQDVSSDIVVTGQRPRLDPGLWRFDRSASELKGGDRSGWSRLAPAKHWHHCILSPDILRALPYALASNPENQGDGMCSALRMRIEGTELVGRQSCRWGRSSGEREVRGVVNGATVTLQSTLTSSAAQSRIVHHITGSRIGTCPPFRAN